MLSSAKHILIVCVLYNLTLVRISCAIFGTQSEKNYIVPNPTIVVNPRGFKVTIPDEEGIQLFAFHGNINKPMQDLEAGQFSRDILHKEGNKWIFSDNNVKLHNGDVIYYWLYVIKNNLGYRRDDGIFHVSGASTGNEHITVPSPGQQGGRPTQTVKKCELSQNFTETVSYLYKQLADAKETNAILMEFIDKSGPSAGKELSFYGELPPGEAAFVAEDIIREKLRLQVQVEKAKRLRNLAGKVYIKFEVATIAEKINIIRAAKTKLQNSTNIRLEY